MPQYMTKQRKLLLDFFQKHIDEAFSAQQIAALLGDEKISVSAVYRNITALEKDGKLQRINHADGHMAYFRYKAHKKCLGCLHLSCKKCGKTFHLDHDSADRIEKAIIGAEDFSLDRSDTILYGVCHECKEKSYE